MKVGDIDLAIIVGWNNTTDQKIKEHQVCVMKCIELEPKTVKHKDTGLPTIIELPKMETILKTKITKKQAAELQKYGTPISAAYTLSGK